MTNQELIKMIPMIGAVGKMRAKTARLGELRRMLTAYSYNQDELALIEKEIGLEVSR